MHVQQQVMILVKGCGMSRRAMMSGVYSTHYHSVSGGISRVFNLYDTNWEMTFKWMEGYIVALWEHSKGNR